MNRFKSDSNGSLVNTTPLFASVWLALFHVVRKNINERRVAVAAKTKSPQSMRKK